MKTSKPAFSPALILADLRSLSRNLWWSWQPRARDLWDRVADVLPSGVREEGRKNPVVLVAHLDARRLRLLAASPDYARAHRQVLAAFRSEVGRPARAPPFCAAAGLSPSAPVAYFSMEFAVHESLPIYAGGLGVLAGDHAKAASDDSLPLVGVGLYYRRGYFRQEIDARGKQRVIQAPARLDHLPLEPARLQSGAELRIGVELPRGIVWARVWRLEVGHVTILLLDSDVRENRPRDRAISHKLYCGTRADRIEQEIIAGIGGARALAALGIRPAVWHLNEGHVAFLTLERLRATREQLGLSVPEALEAIAADTVFTTHTPVPEGNEVFDLALARRYLETFARAAGIPVDDYLALGLDRGTDGRPFLSMTVLALRLSRQRNGVSRLHGEVARRMWQHLWPGFRADEVPITSITNGVHMPSWVAPRMEQIIARHAGGDWRRHLDDPRFWKKARRIPDRELWEAKRELKQELVAFVREREDARLKRCGWSAARRRRAVEGLLDPEVFTIGFARRFALYKRAALLFRDLKRAARLFASRSRPLQIVFAGKPHPEDAAGRALCEKIVALSRRREFRGKVVFLEGYDMEIGRRLVQGVDLWLNNPRRPLEASGTSGQKCPLNGGVNLSILDGWWCEGYSPAVGWTFGKVKEYEDHDLQDREDSASLLSVLENEVLPEYYQRDRSGLPRAWLGRVKAAMAQAAHRFSSSHMVLEYGRRLYAPAAVSGRAFRAGKGLLAKALAAWKEEVLRSWRLVHLRGSRRGPRGALELEVFLGGISPRDIACRDEAGRTLPVTLLETISPGLHVLRVRASGARLRLFPAHPALIPPEELGLTLEITPR
jgi:starch phosphorylase